MHRAAVESMFGFVQHGDEIEFRPCLPAAWNEAEIVLTRAGKKLRIVFTRTDAPPAGVLAGMPALQSGERLRWSALPAEAARRIVLGPLATAPAEPAERAQLPVG
jgi:cellobiose phosphorylase